MPNNNLSKNKHTYAAFTLAELIVSMTIFFMLITVVLVFFLELSKLKNSINAKQSLLEQSYFVMERIQILMEDYSIDYEEYFNRRLVWCDSASDYGDTFARNISGAIDNGHCDRFTAYGNRNSLDIVNQNNHIVHACSSISDQSSPDIVFHNNNKPLDSDSLANGFGCFASTINDFATIPDALYYQSYGQYAQHFVDVQDDVDFVPGVVWDDDDISLWHGPQAILSGATQELYLISQDETQRTYIRRKLVDQGDRNRDGTTGNVLADNRYTLQILKLRWFDAGHTHDFDAGESTTVDGQIDTRACDASQWFVCQWASIGSAFADYRLPLDTDDGWADLLTQDVSVRDRHIIISPLRDPDLAFARDTDQINPHLTIVMTLWLVGKNWHGRVPPETLEAYTITIQTSLASKYFY